MVERNSPMRTNISIFNVAVGTISTTAVFVCLFLFLGNGSTNCGGNSAALSHVSSVAGYVKSFMPGSSDELAGMDRKLVDDRDRLASYAKTHWLRSARFLVSRKALFARTTEARTILVLCDTAYRNVPRLMIGQSPPTHAAAYTDGSTTLITEQEFSRLDRSDFIPLDALITAK